MIRAVLGDVVVVEVGEAQLPDVHDQRGQCLGRQVQLVLPQVARLVVVVLADLVVVGHPLERAGEQAGQPLEGVEHGVPGVDVGGEVDAVVQQVAAPAAGALQPQEGVAERRRRVVEVIRREHQHRRPGVDPLHEIEQLRTVGLGQRRQRQALAQPDQPRREPTQRVPLARRPGALHGRRDRGEERPDGGQQLGLGIGLALGGQEERRPVGLALVATRAAPVVSQAQPGGVVGQSGRPSLFQHGGLRRRRLRRRGGHHLGRQQREQRGQQQVGRTNQIRFLQDSSGRPRSDWTTLSAACLPVTTALGKMLA